MVAILPAILAGAAFVCQGLNLALSLRIRAELLEMKENVLDEVSKVYVRQDVCVRDMRIAALAARGAE